jgi:hypothetical protein
VSSVANVCSYDPTAPGWQIQAPLSSARRCLAGDTGPDGLVYAIGGLSLAIVGEVEAYAFGKCDYIEYQIDVVGKEIDKQLALLALPDLTPQQRAAIQAQIGQLRLTLNNLLGQLKKCHAPLPPIGPG